MNKRDTVLLAEAYQRILEGIYPPESGIEQALRTADQSLKAGQPVSPEVQTVIAQDPRAGSTLVKMVVSSGNTSRLEQHIGKEVWDSIKSDKYYAGDLTNWLTKNNLQVDQLLTPDFRHTDDADDYHEHQEQIARSYENT